MAEYLDGMANPDAEWPWRLEAAKELRVTAPKRPIEWPAMGPPPASDAERIKALCSRLAVAAQLGEDE